MSIDHRKLLKDCIRGQRWDHDIPVLPGAVDSRGEAAESSREELELFVELLDEVLAEDHPESRPSVVRRLEQLRQECLGPGAAGTENHKTFQLLDRDGAPAKDPESVVALELRDANGKAEAFPFKWTICGLIGHASGPGMKFD